MTEPTPTPVDPARVLAALEVLGWPDDRQDAARDPEGPSYGPPGAYWELVEDVIRAADAASSEQSEQHVIEFRAEGWTIKHPLSCRLGDLFGCPVNLAAEDLDGPPVPPGRYEVSVDGIDGRLRVGDRVGLEVTSGE